VKSDKDLCNDMTNVDDLIQEMYGVSKDIARNGNQGVGLLIPSVDISVLSKERAGYITEVVKCSIGDEVDNWLSTAVCIWVSSCLIL
jgi:hypothetical protein